MEMTRAAGPLQTEKNSKCRTMHSILPGQLNQLSSRSEGSGRGLPGGEASLALELRDVSSSELAREGETRARRPMLRQGWLPLLGTASFLISALGIFALDCFTRGQKNSTLIFTKENTIRNCSCSAGIPDCDYSLANLMCSCKTVLPFAVERTSYSGHLTIWFTDTSALGLLLNFTLVRDLKLSLCSTNTLPTEYLAICGLKRLRISTEAKQPSPEQSLVIHNGGESKPREKPTLLHKGWQASPDYRSRRRKNTSVLFSFVFLLPSTMPRTWQMLNKFC
uniref:Exosomal polycystin 1 interacting protein n=1 Tax=Equus asinus TaxID=9793 RepID=A0A9L0IY12_EQUAS